MPDGLLRVQGNCMDRCKAECHIGQPQGSMLQVLCLFPFLLLHYGGEG